MSYLRKLSLLLAFSLLLGAPSALRAASAEMKTDATTLSASGGEVAIEVGVYYGETPAALGMLLPLPEGWSFVKVAGESPPQIAPPAGTTKAVELAWTGAPAGQTRFNLVLKHPVGASGTELKGKVLMRSGGPESTLIVQIALP
jgi:hypothetical protein